MKYDSGMTCFHENIIAALRHMLGNNSEIPKKFSPNDGSPAPLRDYLKEKYGKSYTSHIGDGMRYSCKTSTGFELTFDTILNNPGDKNLTLSWSQVAKFIRDNWDEVFKKDKPKSRPLEILVRTFDEEAMTCPEWVKGKTLTYLEKLNGVHFECKAFSAEFCKLDDITRFFVQHCNCPENCLYHKGTAEKQPSYFDKLREKYPKISTEDEWLFEDYCPANLFLGKNIPDTSNDLCDEFKSDDSQFRCEKCWNSPCAADVTLDNNELEMFEDDYFEHYPVEDTAETAETVPEISEEKSNVEKSLDCETTRKWDLYCEGCKYDINSCCDYPETPDDYCVCGDKRIPKSEADKPTENQIVPQDTSELSNTFNYAVLSTEMGDYLKHKEQQLKDEYMNFISKWGEIFAEAQETLAKHGFGENNGVFEKWFNSLNLPISRRTMYRMISVYKFRSCHFGTNEEAQKLFDSFPKTSQYEIAEGKAPAELVEQVLNGDITTHKKYIELKKQLEEANKRAETEQKARESISYNLDNMEKSYVEFKDKYTEEYYKNTELEKRIKEFESRPIDVCVDHNEVTKRVTEAVNKINSETEQTLAAREQEFAETLHFKDERIWELEDRLKELGSGNTGTDKKIYMVSMTEEDYQKMIVELSRDLCKILSSAVVIDPYGKRGEQ